MNPGLSDRPRPAFHPSQRRPRDAATLILIDRSRPKPRVLLGKRHAGHVFMPSLYVFPGGKVERGDASAAASGALPVHVERRLMARVVRPSPSRAKAYALAAVRELAEETGLMLGTKSAEHPTGLTGEWAIFAECGVRPSLDDIWLIARSITPPGLPRRYDTRFFAADAGRICHSLPGAIHAEAELVETCWVEFDDTKELALHTITRLVLGELAVRLESGIGRDAPVPLFRPRGGQMHREEI